MSVHSSLKAVIRAFTLAWKGADMSYALRPAIGQKRPLVLNHKYSELRSCKEVLKY
jgi:hypothetical protein